MGTDLLERVPPPAGRPKQGTRHNRITARATDRLAHWRVAALVLFAGGIGYLAVQHLALAILLALVPVGLLLLVKPQWTAVLAVAALPFLRDVAGSEGSSINVGLSDVLMTVAAL